MKNLFLLIILFFPLTIFAQFDAANQNITNGGLHNDTDGKVINAHGGGLIQVGRTYYWVGENRKNDVLVSLYKSTDLLNWKYCGDLLTRSSNPELKDANIERPKIIYNETTKQFVMWMHYELKYDYSYARAAVAVSDDIEKPFKYIRSFRPYNNMSRDCTLFKDKDGKAYFFSAARENYDMIQYLLTPDYTDVQEQVATLWPGGHREAPTLFEKDGTYFFINSGCTGWDPNQGKYATAPSIRGPWSELKNFGNETTFFTQSTYVIQYNNGNENKFLYLGDRWDAKNYYNSRYIFLPITFNKNNEIELNWKDKLSLKD